MNKCVIIIAGKPAAGKTTYARHIAEKLNLPFIGKDNIKEKLHDVIKFETSRANSRLYGNASYAVFFHFAECLMKAGVPLVLESNFTVECKDILEPLVEKYGYRALTVMFDADMRVLHERFLKRDVTDERHPGLAASTGFFDDFDVFANGTAPLRLFSIGERLDVDTTDFSRVDYAAIDEKVATFLAHE